MCSRKIFFFFAAGNEILKYDGDKSIMAWKTQECGVAICFLEICFRIYNHFIVFFPMQIVFPVKCF